jgi:CRISPR system Cascade subunit CasB
MSEDNRQHPFIAYLEDHAEDRAMLAELRRGLGREPGEAAGMFPYVVPFLRNERHDADHYLIASLFALHPVSASSGNMGDHLRRYTDAVDDDTATTRRFVQLLNLRRTALNSPLRQHISMLKAKEIAVNWHQLMVDLQYWGHDDHFVQKRWASAYWRSQEKSQSKK